MSHAFGRFVLVGTVLLGACGGSKATDTGGGGNAGGGGTTTVGSVVVQSGDGQTTRKGAQLAVPVTFQVRNSAGAAMPGVSVSFAVTAGGGSPGAATTTTDANGLATTNWTLGSAAGPNTLRASAGTAVAVASATARNPLWTVLVYMAADNSLALAGVGDLDEMDAAGANPEVQVAVQAEFSATEFSQNGYSAASANLPNFNTFRYAVTGTGNVRPGPDHAVQDLGNLDMTAPATLSSFLAWGKASYPAERYLVVLWNHGGGFSGLISDETSAAGRTMTLDQMKSGLAGLGQSIDVLDFDMCLMGGAETLDKVQGFAQFVVASELTVPGEGNPYTPLIQMLQTNTTASTRTIASNWVDGFNTSFAGARPSTTKSAYDMSGYAAFDAALTAFAQALSVSVGTTRPLVQAASGAAQKFDFPYLTDVVSFLDSLAPRLSAGPALTALGSLRAAATSPSFRVSSRVRTGTGSGSINVNRASGLHMLVPSMGSVDPLPSTGPGSFTAYQALYPSKPWTSFLAAYLAGASARPYADLGTARMQGFLLWSSTAIAQNVDVDLWVVEPSGNIFIPWMGSITPNGAFSADSYQSQLSIESYKLNRYVEYGTYKIYATLWADPNNFRPFVELAYRQYDTSAVVGLYAPNFPQLSFVNRWINDPAVTFTKIDGGQYTDIRYMAVYSVTSPPFVLGDVQPGPQAALIAAGGEAGHDGPAPTVAQLATLRRLLLERPRTTVGRRTTLTTPAWLAPMLPRQ